LEVKVWKCLKDKFGRKHRISVERVVSGTGLANCYEDMAKIHPEMILGKVHEDFKNAGDMQGKIVAENAGKNNLCNMAMETMMT
jgi:glucokinase